jgi:hypothetical protein
LEAFHNDTRIGASLLRLHYLGVRWRNDSKVQKIIPDFFHIFF